MKKIKNSSVTFLELSSSTNNSVIKSFRIHFRNANRPDVARWKNNVRRDLKIIRNPNFSLGDVIV